MKSDEYKTITSVSEGFYKEKGSKFYAFAFPVKTEDEVEEKRTALRKQYHDARHHVYAFRLGADMKLYRASDDGEPSNSSGPPVLGQIKSYELTDILIVVIRYFGGTKLGVSGLINAYKTAAEDAILHADIITKTINKSITLKFEYAQMNDVMRIIKDENLKPASQTLELSCKIVLDIRASDYDRIFARFKKLYEITVE